MHNADLVDRVSVWIGIISGDGAPHRVVHTSSTYAAASHFETPRHPVGGLKPLSSGPRW
mgnify:CR=1 FL=1